MPRAYLGLRLAIPLLLALPACNDQSQPKQDAAERQRLEGRMAALRPGPPGAFKCQEIFVLIPQGHSVEGQACPDNKAVVNGWSENCVAANACNTPARLAELNKAAESFCADWCAKKGCAYSYTPHAKCDSSWCMASQSCQANCNVPMLDTCYFQQAAPAYNCQCDINVEGKEPPRPKVEG